MCHNLSLGLATKTRGCKVASQVGDQGVTSHAPGNEKTMRESTLTLPSELPWWELDPKWTPKPSESNFRGQNSMACDIIYIIGKILEHRCLKWACIAHLDIWNTSYGQKKGRESNCQFDSWPQKVKNRPDLLVSRGGATYRCKTLDESYNFASDHISIGGFIAKLWGSKVTGIPTWAISGLPGQKATWIWAPWPVTKYIIRGKVVASSKLGPWWVLCVRVARGLS